ncbi:transposable element Tcb2 transposase [Trichonephila clavipes]|nr:transposable element Tcb2 transposase [Trichonephila clavipes]
MASIRHDQQYLVAANATFLIVSDRRPRNSSWQRARYRLLKGLCDDNSDTAKRREIAKGMLYGMVEAVADCFDDGVELDVSEELVIAQSVISGLWKRSQDDVNVSRCYSTGRLRVTTPNEDRYIYIYLTVTAKRNRRSTASDLSRQLSSATGTTVLRQTVYRRLGHIGLYARRPVRCVPLTATHCCLRLT